MQAGRSGGPKSWTRGGKNELKQLRFIAGLRTTKLPLLQPVMNAQIADYFQRGFTNDEILVLLAESHGVTISKRTFESANLLLCIVSSRSGFE